jgi:ferric-dicitrate binding protein FerR (iron transport regulator)
LRLADGTFVLLGPESELVLEDGFATDSREVSLRGEAYFDVGTSDAGLFTVLVGGVRIEDLGTAFVVRTGEEAAIRVSVTEGRVRVQLPTMTPSEALTLSAGDAADVLAGNQVQRSDLMPDVDLGWREGRVGFRETPLSRVRFDLRRWYGIDLRFEDPALEQRTLTASFENDSVDQVAFVISAALGGVADVRGDTIIISPARGPNTP